MIGLIVTARRRSSRLPDKMLADVCGRPALDVVLERMEEADGIDRRILATTTADGDDALAEIAAARGWLVYRGSEEDVLARYAGAVVRFELDGFVNVDGDDLLCSTEHVAHAADALRRGSADMVTFEGLPFGTAPVGVATAALLDVCAAKLDTETQGWGRFFTDRPGIRCMRIDASARYRRPDIRLTLDYAEDLEIFRRIFAALPPGPGEPTLEEVVTFLDAHPEIVEIGVGVPERYWERFTREHGSAPRWSEERA